MSFRSPGASVTGPATAAGRSMPADCAVIRIGKGRSAPAPAARLILMVIGLCKSVSPIEVGSRNLGTGEKLSPKRRPGKRGSPAPVGEDAAEAEGDEEQQTHHA